MSDRIRKFLSSLGDLDHASHLITPDAEFIAVRAETYPELPLYGTFRGATGLAAFVAGLRAVYDTQSFDVDFVLESETVGFAAGRFDHIIRDTGHHFRSHWVVMCQFEGDRIALYRFYEDTAALEEAMAVRTQCKELI